MRAVRSEIAGEPFRFRHSEALLRSVLEHAAVATFLVGADGRLLYANKAFYDLLGYDQSEPVDTEIAALIHPDDAIEAQQQLHSLLSGETDHYTGERRYLTKSGQPIWVLVSGSATRDERTGERQYTIIQAININRQKQAEAALAESESRWNFALESAGQGVWDHNLNEQTAFFSRMWRTMRGIGPEEYVDPGAESWLARVHPEDRDRIRATADRQNTGELRYNQFEYRERHRDGHWIWILSRGKPVAWNADGTPARILGTDTDITSLKLVESQLALEKERLKVTLEAIADGVIATDALGRVTFLNPVAEQMTGWSQEEAVGHPVDEVFALVDDKTGQHRASPVTECMSRGRHYFLDSDIALVQRNGDRRDVRASAAAVRTPQGVVLGAVLVFQDVTDSRAIQRKLAHTAMHDSLTGLPNRAAFERALDEALEQAREEFREHALCFIDIDRFKQVNDSAGHSAGDALLKEIGRAIRRSCRVNDFAGRIGGDEFALLLPDCSLSGATRVAESVVKAIFELSFTWAGAPYTVGASIGITAVTSKSPSPGELMNEADAACYVAKARGRNCVSVYDGTSRGLEQLNRRA